MGTDAQYVTIVSGLPRSGTSLCMKLLEAGGIPVLTDGIRAANRDNPNGYYEYEPVKKTRQNAFWLEGAAGKAVKMVYLLLYDLPANRDYRVILMRRDLDEVVRSQEIMLGGNPQPAGTDGRGEWIRVFERELNQLTQWFELQQNFRVLSVDYNLLMQDTMPELRSIHSFLDGRVDVGSMAKVIDPALYRNRNLKMAAAVSQ